MGEKASQPNTQFFYDVTTGQILIGERAMEAHLEAGGMMANVEELGSLIVRGKTLKNVTPAETDINWSSASQDEIVLNSKWVYDLLARTDRGKDKRLKQTNNHMISAIARLGLGLSLRQVYRPDSFGSVDKFYDALDLKNVHRVNTRSAWDKQTLLAHIGSLGSRLKRRPLEKDLNMLWAQDPQNNPHAEVYAEVFGSYSLACELAGFFAPKMRERKDYLDWAVTFRWVNSGLTSTHKHLQEFSKRGYGPSESACIDNFGNLAEFNNLADEKYCQEVEDHETKKAELIDLIQAELDSNDDIFYLFADVRTEEDLLATYCKYLVTQALSIIKRSAQTESCFLETDEWVREVILHKKFDHLSSTELIDYAKRQELYYFIWPPKLSHSHLKVKEAPVNSRAKSANVIFNQKKEWKAKLSSIRKVTKKTVVTTNKDRLNDREYLSQRGAEIEKDIARGDVPIELFRGVHSGREMIARHARFKLIGQIAGDEIGDKELKIRMSIASHFLDQLVVALVRHANIDETVIRKKISNSQLYPDI